MHVRRWLLLLFFVQDYLTKHYPACKRGYAVLLETVGLSCVTLCEAEELH